MWAQLRTQSPQDSESPGSLPPELVKLPYLQEIDFTRNYLNGSIPPEWGTMQLVNMYAFSPSISLIGNRLTGSIPKELGNISTLANLGSSSGAWESASIERILLTSNNFTGELPQTFAGLTTLKDFRVADNQFTGKIPNFIQNWTKLEKLVIQGSGFSGPIPSGIALLTKITDLRISDLNGTEATFPPLSDMRNLKTLDLSFNKLTGEIPSSFVGLSNADYM
ncbi:putative leucine-rich repeat receptor-like serine/threonine-protein kinase [Vitis vinifera]|uniref:Putative leucine-rich repeat receptor-like serine/threonine-protein kinase n=1 Tax=Vitis vinifera TaxID=29760 RepID=A0A438FH63_VITVI|nr:putative leucine-rich repeat receptor-like serine/threonine-protein kinase [Vitis vinifera]